MKKYENDVTVTSASRFTYKECRALNGRSKLPGNRYTVVDQFGVYKFTGKLFHKEVVRRIGVLNRHVAIRNLSTFNQE